ncbi:MAG: polysaccharide biosynthesis tyrosine autokinase [Acaryochloris sp. RU_4_1]|nr:polysaccharide biosynthesis tyrosine autokinase [Acaryochloris sp. RU_4_1]NJR54171.1 polysaccharide biosynthesis tyrosine autokinase [Acaryochloris sp. CRU_2_0]
MEYAEDSIDIKNYVRILRRRWLPATVVCGTVVTLTALATFLQKPVFQSEGTLQLKEVGSASISDLDVKGLGGLEALSAKSNPIATEAEILRSEPIIRQTITSLKLQDEDGQPLTSEVFLEALNVTNIKDTDILKVSYKSTDPQEAVDVVNQLMQDYRANNITTNRAEAASARQYIEQQVPLVSAKLRRLDVALRQFKEENGITDLKEEARVQAEVTGKQQTEFSEIQSEMVNANTRAQALRNKLGMTTSEARQVNDLSQSPGVKKILEESQANEILLAETRTLYGSEHPNVLALVDKQAELKSLLSREVGQIIGNTTSQPLRNLTAGQSQQKLTDALVDAEVERLGLEQQAIALTNNQKDYKRKQKFLPRLEQHLVAIERDKLVAQTTYEGLLKALQEIQISENQNIGNVRIVATAPLPKEPIAPRKVFNLAVGMLLGSLLGIGAALLLEAMDTSIKTVQEAKDIFKYTVLGNIPFLKDAEKVSRKGLERPTPDLIVRDNPRSSVSESYRMLQANLKFLSSDHRVQVFVVTSSIPKEGKSTVVANLALALAELGNRVLIIDADLRRPSQHQVWELPNTVGLSNVLVEQQGWATAIRQEDDHLNILTAGVIPPNPVPLIDSHHMAVLLEEFHQAYDYILIDSPPLAVAADALLLGKMTDGILLVTRPGLVDTGSAQSSKETLEKSGQKVLGLVINGVIPENEPDSYYYYYAKDYYGDDASENESKSRKKKKVSSKDRS